MWCNIPGEVAGEIWDLITLGSWRVKPVVSNFFHSIISTVTFLRIGQYQRLLTAVPATDVILTCQLEFCTCTQMLSSAICTIHCLWLSYSYMASSIYNWGCTHTPDTQTYTCTSTQQIHPTHIVYSTCILFSLNSHWFSRISASRSSTFSTLLFSSERGFHLDMLQLVSL